MERLDKRQRPRASRRTWEHPCLLPGALGKVDADGTGMGIEWVGG